MSKYSSNKNKKLTKKAKKKSKYYVCSKTELWNLSESLAKRIAPGLRKFKEQHMGYPSNLTKDEWDSILETLASGFEKLAKNYDEVLEAEKRKILSLFATWYSDLWY